MMDGIFMDFDAFQVSYRPGHLEEEWLLSSFGGWLDDGTIEDVLFSVRGGKEANVYACRAGPSLGGRLLAAKVYRPRKLRELRNDAMYREGRKLLATDKGAGRVSARDQRMARAIRKGTRRGKQVLHTSWVNYEWRALQSLFAQGVSVPEPVASADNAILMEFLGDEHGAASSLERLTVPLEEARSLWEVMRRDLETMLSLGWVHGDLSAYNVLMWEGRLTIIDMPQICSVFDNPFACGLFLRDVERICTWFGRCGLALDPREVADELWDEVFGTEEGVPQRPVSLP
jgi:RIO kinase 1